MKDTVCSPAMDKYFEYLESKVRQEYSVASKARVKGLDPTKEVEISLARNMAERVLGLVSTVAPQLKDSKLVERIKELEKKYGVLDWRVAFKIAEEIARQEISTFEDEREAIEVGIRTGFAYVTVGVVSACLEGFTRLELVDRRDRKGKYFCMNFSGPIRNAGGTAAAVSVLIADYVRNKLGYAEYDPDENEINRVFSEVEHYNDRCVRVQYMPSKEELDFLAKKLPIQISGDPTERVEVPNYKNLARIPTNVIRSGFCLIYSSCIPLKAEKLWKPLAQWGKEFDMMHWSFLEDYVSLKKKMKSGKAKETKSEEDKPKIVPNLTYLQDMVGGRPVLSHASEFGGFRLRFGRSRCSGLSAAAIHPATMHVLNDFLAFGTQLKTERPGKSTVTVPCDTIEGPVVKLKNGNVVRLETEKEAKIVKHDIDEIIFVGDMLVSFGDFFNRAHTLFPPGYCEEWWAQELEKAIVDNFGNLDFQKAADMSDVNVELIKLLCKNPTRTKLTSSEALKLSKNLEVPLHPRYTFHWTGLSKDSFELLISKLPEALLTQEQEVEKIILPTSVKSCLERIGLPHVLATENVIIEKEYAMAFYVQLAEFDTDKLKSAEGSNTYEKIKNAAKIKIRDKSGLFAGARMGRPEKSKMRKMKGSPHGLFPVGEEGGKMRSFQVALDKGKVTSSFSLFKTKTGKETVYPFDQETGEPNKRYKYSYQKGVLPWESTEEGLASTKQTIPIKTYFSEALRKLGMNLYPDLIKGVKGTVNREHIPEHLSKAILRAKHDVYVNKDGTVRIDATEVPMTHFKPKEIFAPIERLKELGYEKDIEGKELISDDQVVELKPQDVVLPCCPDIETPSDEVMLNTANFIDELLIKLYNLEPYYNCSRREDLIGHLVVGLAPHTSAGIVGRIIGFTKTQGLLAHPMFHCACRRDCDGDELGFFLLLDGLLNFSKKFLPDSRGATMDAPLVLTSILIPSEVDDMVFDMDCVYRYPLEFYNACLEYKKPWDVKIEIVKDRLGKESQYENYGFTHENGNVNEGIMISSYKTLPTMRDKLFAQMDLASKLRAVRTAEVAASVINNHFMKDIKGNLRKFSQQEFRCVNCNTKYRRPPLSGILH